MIEIDNGKPSDARDVMTIPNDLWADPQVQIVARAFAIVRDHVIAGVFLGKRDAPKDPDTPATTPHDDHDGDVGGYTRTLTEHANSKGAALDFQCESWIGMHDGKKRPSDTQAKYEGQVFCKNVALAMGYPPIGKNRLPGMPPAHRMERHFDENLHHEAVLAVWWNGLLRRMPNLLKDHPFEGR